MKPVDLVNHLLENDDIDINDFMRSQEVTTVPLDSDWYFGGWELTAKRDELYSLHKQLTPNTVLSIKLDRGNVIRDMRMVHYEGGPLPDDHFQHYKKRTLPPIGPEARARLLAAINHSLKQSNANRVVENDEDVDINDFMRDHNVVPQEWRVLHHKNFDCYCGAGPARADGLLGGHFFIFYKAHDQLVYNGVGHISMPDKYNYVPATDKEIERHNLNHWLRLAREGKIKTLAPLGESEEIDINDFMRAHNEMPNKRIIGEWFLKQVHQYDMYLYVAAMINNTDHLLCGSLSMDHLTKFWYPHTAWITTEELLRDYERVPEPKDVPDVRQMRYRLRKHLESAHAQHEMLGFAPDDIVV
jgi:hypothetical protein